MLLLLLSGKGSFVSRDGHPPHEPRDTGRDAPPVNAAVAQGGLHSLAGRRTCPDRPRFLQQAIALQIKYGNRQSTDNTFKTKGLLLKAGWADFFKQHDWLAGLSLEGPLHIHNRYRHDKCLQPTHHKVEETAGMPLRKGMTINAFCCVTDNSSAFAEEIYNYYKNLGLTWMQFIPVVENNKEDNARAASGCLYALAAVSKTALKTPMTTISNAFAGPTSSSLSMPTNS